jgi:hypothetical protein
MNSKITVSLIPDGDVEAFNEGERNLAQVRVCLDGKSTDPSKTIVTLMLSREGMIGLATELLRAVNRTSRASSFSELMPSQAGCMTEDYGVFLHPNSCRLNLMEVSMGSIAEAIKEAQQAVPSDGHKHSSHVPLDDSTSPADAH